MNVLELMITVSSIDKYDKTDDDDDDVYDDDVSGIYFGDSAVN